VGVESARVPGVELRGISLFIADVDGTLVTPDKALTARALDAVAQLRASGVGFSITSGRPPRGMKMLIEPLGLTEPFAAFNGGMLVRPDLTIEVAHLLPPETARETVRILEKDGLDVWIYRGTDWCLHDKNAPHAAQEEATVKFPPTIIRSFDGVLDDVVKIVGVCDDPERMKKTEQKLKKEMSLDVSAALSQSYYLDVTHLNANKGQVVLALSEVLKVPPSRIATIGDMPNDVQMFERSGLSIAMGNASESVKKQANQVTASNLEEGFALAVERFILKRKVA
jgi:Cof subfamily protein (haloacid dehalogenase superfamily)